ncbi:MAG: metal-dependent phosphohydrolase [Cyanobacteria bacterium P01_D01_bin.156]
MYSPKQTLVETFISYLKNTYHTVFGSNSCEGSQFLESIARLALETIAQSDALYHNLEHTLLVTSVGQEILQARRFCEGGDSVSALDWLHVTTALLCHDIGYCKGVCAEDDAELGRYCTGLVDDYVFLPFGATDAALSAYHVDRSKQFVEEHLRNTALIDGAIVQQIIEQTRFPATDIPLPAAVQALANMGRSADLIGQFSDRNYLQKLPALFYEFEQNGTNRRLGYHHLSDVKLGLSEFYWQRVHSYVEEAIECLKHTPNGQCIVTELFANVSMSNTNLCA